jgi:hypothetical protein
MTWRPANVQAARWKTAAAKTNYITVLPKILQDDEDFALMFLLAYLHRASKTLVKALDKIFG